MTFKVSRTWEEGTGVPCFIKLSETPSFKQLTVKNVKLNVQTTFELRWINSFTGFFHGFDNKFKISLFLEHFPDTLR